MSTRRSHHVRTTTPICPAILALGGLTAGLLSRLPRSLEGVPRCIWAAASFAEVLAGLLARRLYGLGCWINGGGGRIQQRLTGATTGLGYHRLGCACITVRYMAI